MQRSFSERTTSRRAGKWYSRFWISGARRRRKISPTMRPAAKGPPQQTIYLRKTGAPGDPSTSRRALPEAAIFAQQFIHHNGAGARNVQRVLHAEHGDAD